MKRINLKLQTLLLLVIAGFFMSSCEEPDTIGLQVQPANDKLNVLHTDTLSLNTYTVREDSIRSDETVSSLLGSCLDPVFGLYSADFYTQLRLSANNTDFGENAAADSIVLTLVYDKTYGDTLTSQTIKVYELLQDIYRDSAYFSNSVFTKGNLLATQSITPRPRDSVKVYNIKKAPHLRIKLDPTFSDKLIQVSGKTELSDNTNFLKFLKGLYITSENVGSKGAIISFNLLHSLSQVTMYYHNKTNDSLAYNFIINENCARINHFNHFDYSQASSHLKSQIMGDTAKGDSILYLQSMAGLKVKIKYPYIKDLIKNGKIAINKAELIIKLDQNDLTYSEYAPPPQLVLLEEQEGLIRFIIDQYESSGTNYYGGIYNSAKKEYRFNIARHLQQILSGEKENLGLSLVVWTPDRPNTPNRVVLYGSKRFDPLRLSVTFTKLN